MSNGKRTPFRWLRWRILLREPDILNALDARELILPDLDLGTGDDLA